ncbi:MAG: DUF2007 domain-containing protein [Nitrospinales bacterium]
MGNEGSRLKTIARFYDLPLAELAKLKLESEDIPCFLQDSNMVGIAWQYSFAVGGIRLKVPEEFVENAKEILNEDCSADLDFVEEEFPKQDENDICEKCHSPNLKVLDARRKAGAWSLLIWWLIFAIPLIFFGKRYQCEDCQHIMKF